MSHVVTPDQTRALITRAGGPTRIASMIGCSKAAVSQWRKIPADRVLQIERALDGKLTRHEMRPDLYPPEEAAA